MAYSRSASKLIIAISTHCQEEGTRMACSVLLHGC